ncbi:MAG: HlyD family efflux transporter periplasmic adaptor subunit [Candidatus Melainabacteria bacterium]|nr:HlyD family efflux transporter periplasmic adaptor subunit [Candidatus Melainabacteria bacterium]
MRSLASIETPFILKTFAYVVGAVFFIAFISLFLPWRQTITGVGKVTVFSPMNRPQLVQSQISGKIVNISIHEGDWVERGQLLIELEELEEKFLDKSQLKRLQGQRLAYLDKRNAVERLINTLERQINSLLKVQSATVPNAGIEIRQTEDKQIASQQKLKAAEQNFKTAQLNFSRSEKLYEKGLSSRRDFELAELALVKAKSEYEASTAELSIAGRDITQSRFSYDKVSAEAALKVQEAEAKLAQSFEKLADINSEIFKLDINLANMESRITQRKIYAPADGQIVRLKVLGQGETVKSGSDLLTIVPKSSDQAVELYISDVFAPLVSIGREVRLQFSGFPALQFSGWPTVALGTFPGIVKVIDANANEEGEYRILVQPDYKRINSKKDKPWPNNSFLRPGSNVVGWVILDEVPVWYEFWRILNGFPPTMISNPVKSTYKRKIPKVG